MSEKKCSECGTSNSIGSKFCRSCGYKLSSDVQSGVNLLEKTSDVLGKVSSTVSKVESTINSAAKIGSTAEKVSSFIVRPPAEWKVVVGEMLPVAGQQIAEATISTASQQVQKKVMEEITQKMEEKQENPLPKMTPNMGTPPIIPPMPERSGECCSACNSPLKPGAKFCSKCGAKTGLTSRSVAEPNLHICQTCKSPIRPGAKFCRKCGTKV